MIKTITKPQQNQININIPNSYIGRDIECIITPITPIKTPKITNLKGVFNSYASSDKLSQEKTAWQNAVLEKFSK
jgi:hypothetical protein